MNDLSIDKGKDDKTETAAPKEEPETKSVEVNNTEKTTTDAKPETNDAKVEAAPSENGESTQSSEEAEAFK